MKKFFTLLAVIMFVVALSSDGLPLQVLFARGSIDCRHDATRAGPLHIEFRLPHPYPPPAVFRERAFYGRNQIGAKTNHGQRTLQSLVELRQ